MPWVQAGKKSDTFLLLNIFFRDGEHCVVLSASSSSLGDAVVFTSGSLYNLTSGTWSSLQEPPLSFNMASVRFLNFFWMNTFSNSGRWFACGDWACQRGGSHVAGG